MCPVLLDDISPAGIKRHLKAGHLDTPSNPWENRKRSKCCWGEGCRSGEMNYESLGKHIAEIHLRSTMTTCPNCGATFARGDSFYRHERETCGSSRN